MDKILLIDGSTQVSQAVAELLGDECSVSQVTFGEEVDVKAFGMIILEADGPLDSIQAKVSKIRFACGFSDIPIIVIKQREDMVPIEHFLNAGATEVLALDAPPGACRQILRGYLIPNRKPLDKEMAYLSPFIENTLKVLHTMSGTQPTFREVYFNNDMRIFGDISGIIGLSGDSEGTVAITLYWNLARQIIARMMKVQQEHINAEYIHDGVGELINMISGSTKKMFKGTPFHFNLSLPTVVVGSGHQLGHPEGSSIAVLIFDVGEDSFVLQVCLKPKKKILEDTHSDHET
jgi:chemotaxis protein CheX